MSTTRQLSAVMFSDIEGFSAIMQKHEEQAAVLRSKYKHAVTAAHKTHQGKIIQFYGDGCLSIFNSVVNAVECALEIQSQLRQDVTVPVRIGLHLGDIVISGNEVYGDGVNTAARIESLGVAGSVLLSDKVQDELRNHPAFQTVSVGTYQLKNIDRPVEVFAIKNEGLIIPIPGSLKGKTEEKKQAKKESGFLSSKAGKLVAAFAAVIVLGIAGYFIINRPAAKNQNSNLNKVAVLPFTNISKNPESEYMSDGITEELTSTLSGISGLKVISRTSTQQYKDTKKTIDQIGKELEVGSLIEGSVIEEGGNIKINVKLFNSGTGEIIWKEAFEKNVGELLVFYSNIAQQIAYRLDVIVKDAESNKLKKAKNVNPELHQLYLKGLYYTNKFTIPDYKTAIGLYDQALAINPDYAPALAGKAISNALMGVFDPAISITKALPQTLLYSGKALAIDSTQPLANMALGYASLFFQRNMNGADSILQRVIKTDPSNDMAYTVLILINLYKGNTDSADYWLQKGKAISPFSFFLTHHEGRVLYLQNKKAEAFEAYKKNISVYHHMLHYDHLANLYNRSGMYKETLELLDSAKKKFPELPATSQAWLAEAYFKTGDKTKAAAIIKQLEEGAANALPNYAVFAAAYYAGINEKEKAFALLDKAVAANDVDLLWLKSEPHFKSLQNDARFAEYLRKAGF